MEHIERTVAGYLGALSAAVETLPAVAIESIISIIFKAFEQERCIFVFGNGGSAATASHSICDLTKGTLLEAGAKRLRAMALTDNVPLLTAWANDASYAEVFSEQLKGFVRAGDVAFAISASGNSLNVVRALQVAREAGAATVGLAGFDGGDIRSLCDVCAVVPSRNMQIIEDMHHSICHCIFSVVRERIRVANSETIAAAALPRK